MSSVNVFQVVDSAASPVPLFEVRQNGDTVIGGILTVNGTGTSTFAGDVSIGGNLTVLHTLLGSKTSIDTRGKILFIEDIGEYKYHIDLCLYELV